MQRAGSELWHVGVLTAGRRGSVPRNPGAAECLGLTSHHLLTCVEHLLPCSSSSLGWYRQSSSLAPWKTYTPSCIFLVLCPKMFPDVSWKCPLWREAVYSSFLWITAQWVLRPLLLSSHCSLMGEAEHLWNTPSSDSCEGARGASCVHCLMPKEEMLMTSVQIHNQLAFWLTFLREQTE